MRAIYYIQKTNPLRVRIGLVFFVRLSPLTGFWRWGTCPAFSLTSFVIIVPVPSRRAARQRLSFLLHHLRHREQRVPPDVFIYECRELEIPCRRLEADVTEFAPLRNHSIAVLKNRIRLLLVVLLHIGFQQFRFDYRTVPYRGGCLRPCGKG